MEQGLTVCLKDLGGRLPGRKVEVSVGDTGGNPAGAKTKAEELVERDKVDAILGPLAAFELLAIPDYLAPAQVPTLAGRGRRGSDAAQASIPSSPAYLRHVGAGQPRARRLRRKQLHMKRIITISDDFAFGHEECGGFQRVFEDEGGQDRQEAVGAAQHRRTTRPISRRSRGQCTLTSCSSASPARTRSSFIKQYHVMASSRRSRCSPTRPRRMTPILRFIGEEAPASSRPRPP